MVEQRKHTIFFTILVVIVGMKVQLPRIPCIPVSKNLVKEPPNDPVLRGSIHPPIRIPLPDVGMSITVDGNDGIVNGRGLNMVVGKPSTHVGVLWKQVRPVGDDIVVSDDTLRLQAVSLSS